MAELRLDPLTGRWVVLAPGRAARPHDAPADRPPGPPADDPAPGCPFCPGGEAHTPPEVARIGPGAPDGPGWEVRVVPNRYPLVGGPDTAAEDADLDPHADPHAGGSDLRRRRPAGGVHEVVVLSPSHHRSLGRLDDRQAHAVLLALQARARAHAAAGHRYTQLLVNHGLAAGASLAHPHAQVVAIDVAPPAVVHELAHLVPPAGCVLCRELRHHADDPELIVTATDDAVLWCPWWSATADELLLAPRRHLPRFEDAGAELAAVATVLRDGLARLDRALGDPAHNVVLHTRPAGEAADFHWHVHVRPRRQVDAGFELGTGLSVSTRDPAEAAADLRAPWPDGGCE